VSYFICPNPTLICSSSKKNQNHTISIGVKSEIEMYSEAIENTNERKGFWDMTVSFKAAANVEIDKSSNSFFTKQPPQNPASAYILPTKMV
jgi:hypothetical protein